jgi:hypothetical protein
VNKSEWSTLIDLLDQETSIWFDEALTNSEVSQAETRYGFQFPSDLRAFLQTALPRGYSFPNWRSDAENEIRAIQERMDQPLQGLLFDIERNNFWLPEWGSRPASFDDAKEIAKRHVEQAPRLIPINAHRMMPDRPQLAGNPVLSVHQTDIIYYGFDLEDYLRHEFRLPGRKPWPPEIRTIEFWDVNRWQNLSW